MASLQSPLNRTGAHQIGRALVTGGAGFVGHHLANRLLAEGCEVVILDDLSTGHQANLPEQARFVRGDIRDAAKVAEAMHGCDTVFHLAARVDLRKSLEDPADCLSVNVGGTAQIVQQSLKNPAGRLVFASSAAVYPLHHQAALTEADAELGSTPYALSKRAGEQTLEMFARFRGLDACALRCFNIYGPRQRPDGPYAAVIPRFIQLAKQGLPLTVFGAGTQTRDFIHVSDVVELYVRAARSRAQGAFNAGTGTASSVNELARLIAEIERKSTITNLPAKDGDASASIADLTLMERTWGYRPRMSLGDGLRALYREST